MSDTLRSLLAGVISNPLEDTPRLMYADELQESGCPIDYALAEFIKLSIELANHKKNVYPRKDGKLKGIMIDNNGPRIDSYGWYQRGIEITKQQNEVWLQAKEHSLYKTYLDLKPNKFIAFEVERGFINSITCTANNFLDICDQLIWNENMITGGGFIGDNISTPVDWVEEEQKPCPPTAHPVREVYITTLGNHSKTEYAISLWEDEYAPKYGIKFEVG